jgi:hypothetical protein
VPNPKAGQGVMKLPTTKRSARRKPAIACLFCRERKIACGAPPVGSADTTCKYVFCAPPPLSGKWETNIGVFSASAHGVRASVNTPQCRGVVFISVVTTAGVTTGNPRTQIMCRLHSSHWYPHRPHAYTRMHIPTFSVSFGHCILNSIFFSLSASQSSVVYNARILTHCPLWIPPVHSQLIYSVRPMPFTEQHFLFQSKYTFRLLRPMGNGIPCVNLIERQKNHRGSYPLLEKGNK